VALRLKNLFFRLADGLLLYDVHAKSIGERLGFAADRLAVVGNSQRPLPNTRAIVRERDARGQEWLVVCRLTPEKRVDLAIGAVEYLAQGGATVNLTIVGEGPDRARLERLAAASRAEIKFLGAVYNHHKLAELYMRSDICVSPGNVGLTAIDSMSFGCPVVTHSDMSQQMPEAGAVVPGATGTLSNYGDSKDLALKAWNFVATSEPNEVARSCRAEVARHWTPEAHARRITEAVVALGAS
jgi:glycosyltransferase involved in cell wall biosynthesis